MLRLFLTCPEVSSETEILLPISCQMCYNIEKYVAVRFLLWTEYGFRPAFMQTRGFNIITASCISVCSIFYLRQQPHAFQIAHMFFPARPQIDPRRLHRTVSQHIRKFHNIPTHFVICFREQMAEVMWEHSGLLHSRISA